MQYGPYSSTSCNMLILCVRPLNVCAIRSCGGWESTNPIACNNHAISVRRALQAPKLLPITHTCKLVKLDHHVSQYLYDMSVVCYLTDRGASEHGYRVERCRIDSLHENVRTNVANHWCRSTSHL